MDLGLFSFKLKEEFDRVEVLHWGHFSFVILASLVELLNGNIGFGIIFKLIFISFFYYFFTQTKKNLYYSFWSFSFTLMFYFIFCLLSVSFGSTLSIFYFLSAIILGIEMFILYSPIYYPQVSWWEYDFRYRDDLKIKVQFQNECHQGRLTDLRREAGCVALFENIPLGEELIIIPFDGWNNFELRCEIMSRRQYSIGRPYDYGVKFIFLKEENRTLFQKFCQFWKNERRDKLRKKFTQKNI